MEISAGLSTRPSHELALIDLQRGGAVHSDVDFELTASLAGQAQRRVHFELTVRLDYPPQVETKMTVTEYDVWMLNQKLQNLALHVSQANVP